MACGQTQGSPSSSKRQLPLSLLQHWRVSFRTLRACPGVSRGSIFAGYFVFVTSLFISFLLCDELGVCRVIPVSYTHLDVYKRQDDGWAIYEVKSSTSDDKAVYIADVAYQKFVLEHCGVKVTGTYLVVLNRDYIFDGTLDLQKLFKVTDVGLAVAFGQDNDT